MLNFDGRHAIHLSRSDHSFAVVVIGEEENLCRIGAEEVKVTVELLKEHVESTAQVFWSYPTLAFVHLQQLNQLLQHAFLFFVK